ncbi:MAG: formate/nitrite transporter family protein [Bacilli bacterium]|nr:formate/nitrite transporter family protein [Bacilli bacterium]
MKKLSVYLIKSILAGFMIGVGGTIFLSIDNKIIGASLFAIGLFMIVVNEYNLYTGKIGYLLDNKPSYLIEILMTIIGNFIGTFIVGFALKFTRLYPTIHEKVKTICNIKLEDTWSSILILSIFCGMLMYLAVNGYKTLKDQAAKYISVFICVIVFILSSFEHSIANMYYFTVAGWSSKAFFYLFIMILGNMIGGLTIPILIKIKKKLEK